MPELTKLEHKTPHLLAGKKVKVVLKRPHPQGTLNTGDIFTIEDWQDRVMGRPWTECGGSPATIVYMMRQIENSLPMDNHVVYGHGPQGFGHILHCDELGEVVP